MEIMFDDLTEDAQKRLLEEASMATYRTYGRCSSGI